MSSTALPDIQAASARKHPLHYPVRAACKPRIIDLDALLQAVPTKAHPSTEALPLFVEPPGMLTALNCCFRLYGMFAIPVVLCYELRCVTR